MDNPIRYKLINPEDTFARNAIINICGNNTMFYSCSGNAGFGETFHFIKETLRGAKQSFALNYGKGKKIIWREL